MEETAILEVSEESFERDVVQRSHQAPVVVDFWAEWCGPCRFLGPVLEKLAAEADGGWTLAKVDVDANPRLAARFGIQGIPAVRAFRDGREVAEFVGALPEQQVRAWLAQLGPSPADTAFEEGERAESSGDLEGAASAYETALAQDPAHSGARAALERIRLVQRAASVDETELIERLERDSTDHEAAEGLADLYASRGEIERALEVLLRVIRVISGEERDAARVHLLRLLDTLPIDDVRAMGARRALALALF